jgi:hypothetical protein
VGNYDYCSNGLLMLFCSQDKEVTDIPDVLPAEGRIGRALHGKNSRRNHERKPGETLGVNV